MGLGDGQQLNDEQRDHVIESFRKLEEMAEYGQMAASLGDLQQVMDFIVGIEYSARQLAEGYATHLGAETMRARAQYRVENRKCLEDPGDDAQWTPGDDG